MNADARARDSTIEAPNALRIGALTKVRLRRVLLHSGQSALHHE
jgi:hypothetical protein